MFPSFVPDKARPLASRPFLIPSIFLTCLASSILPQGPSNTLSVMAILLSLCSRIPKATTGKAPQDYIIPIQAAITILQWLDFYVFHSPDEFYRVKDAKNDVKKETEKGEKNNQEAPKTRMQKIRWAFDLNTTYRGIGWNWKVKNIREALSTDKWTFVGIELSKAFAWFLLFDLCYYSKYSTGYTSQPAPDIFAASIPRQVLLAIGTGVMNYCTLNLQYSLTSALLVGLGLYSIEALPPMMGRLRNVTTVRGFWSTFWHQNLRRKLTLPYNLLTRYVSIPRGTLVSRYTQLYMAFIATTLIHHIGAMNLPQSSRQNNLYQVAFFMLQPVAITVEDFVIYLGKKAGYKESRLTRVIGRVWTFVSFVYTLRFATAFFLNAGMMSERVLPSIAIGVSRYFNKPSNVPGLKEP